MGIRVTGISTPIGGVSWEYTTKEMSSAPLTIFPGQKIKVFISSICGVEKYDKVRLELKNAIEDTKLADVYIFEGEGASTLSAGSHYTLALEDSDICIFLIDNNDGIQPGVQSEIDTVNKHNIKALYYFCDEVKKEKTALEQSLRGAHFAKSKTVHSFSELSKDGAQALIDDIVAVYHYYCTGRIVMKSDNVDEYQRVDVSGTETYQFPTIPKTMLKNVDKCRNYILKFVFGNPRGEYPDETLKTSEVDDWGVQFLQVLFEGKSIRSFNTAMFLEELKAQQEELYHQVIQLRWKAVQAYFVGDIEKCSILLDDALKLAKESSQPMWLIKDILIDIRNHHWIRCTAENKYYEPQAQKELNESSEEIYYPILDRIHNSLHEKYIEGLYKKKTESPYSVTIGNSFDQYGEMLASSFIVSMYNGSLTHLLLTYERVRNFIFYLSCKYDDWNLKLNLYKLAIFAGQEKEIEGIQNSYPEILNNITADEAASIMEFCLNHPIHYKRLISQLLAFGAVGYYLDEKRYEYQEQHILNEIQSWFHSKNPVIHIGYKIFKSLSGVELRMSSDKLSEICCQFMELHYRRWYTDMFKFIERHIDMRKMSEEASRSLIDHVNSILDDEEEREQINYAPQFLCVLRKQKPSLTNSMDKRISEIFPKFYNNVYKLETTENQKTDMPEFVKKYINSIKACNDSQGKNGTYFGYGTREIATVRSILLKKDIDCDLEIMDMLISVVSDTLLVSKESISIKLDAISLLISIILNYPSDFKRNQEKFERLYKQRESIETIDHFPLSSNVDSVSLNIGLQFLYAAMGKDVYCNILELMPLIQGDIPTTIAVSHIITEYYDNSETVILPFRIESIVLQNTLQWIHSDYLDIRWNATKILLAMNRNPENHGIVNHQLVKLIDSDCLYIKNLILRNINKIRDSNDDTKKYILSKCQNDANYVVRMVCSDIIKHQMEEKK